MKVFKKLFGIVEKWYDKVFEKYKEEGYAGVVITNILKDMVESKVAASIVAFTPNPYDDRLLATGKRVLPDITLTYALIHKMVQEGATKSEALLAVVDYFQKIQKDGRGGFYTEITGDVIVALSDRKVSKAEGAMLGQKIFLEVFGKFKLFGK